MPTNPNNIARILVSGGIVITVFGFLLSEVGYVSTGVCPLPSSCHGGGVSHPFFIESITAALVGIAIAIIGSVMAYRLKTANPKILNTT